MVETSERARPLAFLILLAVRDVDLPLLAHADQFLLQVCGRQTRLYTVI
jgi:hypothetical protein